jgi:spermidine/putrescine transport system substrate-binding protein
MSTQPEHRSTPIHRTSRRGFLATAALLAAGGPTLASCTRKPAGSSTTSATGLTIASPQHPVTWPYNAGNEPIADNLTPEKNATLRLYNYADYIDPAALKSFEKKYDVKVRVSTFNDNDEALTKVRQGTVPYDIWIGGGYDLLTRQVAGNLVRPLNHTYIPNIANVWPAFTNPWYDQAWRYTVPYTVYTTGLGWRSDRVKTDVAALPNPYDTLWDPKYRGQTAILDDYRSTIEMCLLRAGITDVNSDKPADLAKAEAQLQDLAAKVAPKVTITMYQALPAGDFGQCAMWSGDAVNAVYYLPKKTSPDVLGYWYPSDGKGMIDNDLLVILKGGKNPVLSHLFLNHMLDEKISKANFGFTGYQPPQNALNTESLVEDGYVPKNLSSAVIKEEYFQQGYPALALSVENDAAWHKIWLAFKAGR